MKRFFTLLIGLMAIVGTVSADGLTIYMDASGFLNGEGNEAFAVWNHSNSSFIKFTNISGNYYKADLPDGYTTLNLVRYDKNQEPSWTSKWNQTGDLTPSSADNYFIVTGLNYDNCPCTTTGAHKVYVKNMEGADAIHFYAKEKTGWTEVNGSEPGNAMTEETIEAETWYSYLNLTNKNLYAYFEISSGDYKKTGVINPDLTSSDQYYYYYPSKYQAVLRDEALATPARVHFRVEGGKEGESLKWYIWDNDGLRDDITSTTTAGGVDWLTFESYQSSFSIQFYTFNDGDADTNNDKSYGSTLNLTPGDNYYYTSLPRKTIEKYETSYSIAYWTDSEQWLGDGISVSSQAMTSDGDFKFKTTFDNSAGNFYRYCITPTSNIVDGKIVSASKVISPISGNFDINGFETHESSAIPCIWTIINLNSVPAKYDITFNYANMNWTSKPYRTATISDVLYSTWSNGEKYTVSGAEKIYTVGANNTNSVTLVEKSADTVFPSNTGILVKGISGDVIKFNAVAWDATASTIGTNYLVGTGNTAQNITATENTYVFSWDGSDASTVGFYLASGDGELAAHKAYLDLTDAPGARDNFLGFNFGEETDGIREVRTAKNGDAIYNMQGVRLSKMQKGLNIVNGKKVLIK
ncbi:MAG: hypothetical protein IJV13_00630 [Prevotella sp.]|nr:hypothetical protein [Prevotella sp.]